jgi:outer membrane protein assembly factor BamE (lipoprotein component of BamABCDE complex)
MRSRARWLTVVVAGIALASLSVAVWNVIGHYSTVRRHHLERVEIGMTRAEVEALLGGPPGDYRTNPERFSISHHSLAQFRLEEAYAKDDWIVDEAMIQVWFDANDRVVRTRLCKAIDTQADR